MKNEKLQISRKGGSRGEDGYKTFSVRMKEATVASLDGLARETSRSRNELINILLEYALENAQVVD